MYERRLPVLSERLRALRGTMTQEEFATFLDISRPMVGFYENGTRIPDALVLRRIAERYHVSTDWLLGLSDSPVTEQSMALPRRFTQELSELAAKGYGANGGKTFETLLYELVQGAQAAAGTDDLYPIYIECLTKLCEACHTASKSAEPIQTPANITLQDQECLLFEASYNAHNVLSHYFEICKNKLQTNLQEEISLQ